MSNPPPSSTNTDTSGKRQFSKNRRFRKTEKDTARSLLNADAAPVNLEKFFATIISIKRANITTDFDETSADRISAPVYNLISSSQITLGLTDLLGQQIDGDYLPHGLRLGVNIGFGFKLISSTPESNFIDVNNMLPLTHNELELPDHILQLADQIGKASAMNDHFILRYRNNLLSIKRLFAHAIVVSRNQPDADRVALFTANEQAALNQWNADGNYYIDKLVFEDDDSVRWLQSNALREFKLVYDQGYVDGQGRTIGWPPLDLSRVPSRNALLNWFGNLVQHYYPNVPGNFLPLAAVMMIQRDWLARSAQTFAQLDNVFANTAIAQVTLDAVFTHWHIYNFRSIMDDSRLIELVGQTTIYYQQQIANRLRSFIKMGSLGKTKFGNISQILNVPDNQLVDISDPFPHKQINHVINQASGVLRLENNSMSVAGAISRLTKNTTFEPNYNYVMHNNLKGILENHVNGDRIIK